MPATGGGSLAEAGLVPSESCGPPRRPRTPRLPDTYYVERLAAPGTIDTIPEKTLLAFADHGSGGRYAQG